ALVRLANSLDETLDGAFIVPGAGEVKSSSGDKESAGAIVVHLGPDEARSVWLPVWGRDRGSEYANVLIPIPYWARENAEQLELPSDRLNPYFTLSVRRAAGGPISGNVRFVARPRRTGGEPARELHA